MNLGKKKAYARWLNGMDTLSSAIEATFGPGGQFELLDKRTGAISVVSEGAAVAKGLILEDPYEMEGAQILGEAAIITKKNVNDGTATAVILAHAMITYAWENQVARVDLERLKMGIDKATNAVVAAVRGQSIDVTTLEEIIAAAGTAASDRAIGELVANAMDMVGKYGVISIGESKSREYEIDHGGDSAEIRIGADTKYDLEQKKLFVEKGLMAANLAVDSGIVPGGGIALLNTMSSLEKIKSNSEEESFGIRIVAQALEVSLFKLVSKTNQDYETVVALIGVRPKKTNIMEFLFGKVRNAKMGFDVLTGQPVDMIRAWIIDPCKVVCAALETATSTAIKIFDYMSKLS